MGFAAFLVGFMTYPKHKKNETDHLQKFVFYF